jgi:DNA-binding ferritin-like protein (Dps family)
MSIFEKVIGDFDGKRRWKNYKARSKALPAPYRTAVEGIERYLMHFGSISSDMTIFEDLIDLFERAAVDGTPVRDIVGDDPVAFIEQFKENYMDEGWIAKERKRFTDTIDKAEAEQAGES